MGRRGGTRRRPALATVASSSGGSGCPAHSPPRYSSRPAVRKELKVHLPSLSSCAEGGRAGRAGRVWRVGRWRCADRSGSERCQPQQPAGSKGAAATPRRPNQSQPPHRELAFRCSSRTRGTPRSQMMSGRHTRPPSLAICTVSCCGAGEAEPWRGEGQDVRAGQWRQRTSRGPGGNRAQAPVQPAACTTQQWLRAAGKRTHKQKQPPAPHPPTCM